jgi:glycosyltransferase involved in cell wall biosynthesis
MANQNTVSVSVVIPVSNREKVIERAVYSVLRQSLPPHEIIIVNDGSNDNTLGVCEKILAPGVRIISLEKQYGAQKARNAGIRAAKGNWIAFLDSDDEWLPNQLEKLAARLREVDYDPATVVYCDGYVQKGQFEPRQIWRCPHIEGKNVFREVLMYGGSLFQGMLTSREAMEKMGLLDENVQAYQEWDTAIQLSRFCRFLHIQEPLFIYHRYSEESVSKNPGRRLAGFSYILNKYRYDIHSLSGIETWRKHLIHLFTLCYDMGMWPQKDFYISLMGMTAQEEDRILVNLIINKMVAKDWHDAKIIAKSANNLWSVKLVLLRVLRFFHINPGRLVSIRKKMLWLKHSAPFSGQVK